MRIGAKKRPFYRVVVVDERKKRNGSYLELLGTYNPLTNPKEINLKQDRIDEWTKKGALPSDGFLRIIGKAPQRNPRKPKKEKSPSAPKEEVKAAEEVVSDAPIEEAPAPVESVENNSEPEATQAETVVEEATPEVVEAEVVSETPATETVETPEDPK